MKIVALTDIHGKYTEAASIIRAERPDAVVIGGDLTTVGSMKEASGALGLFRSECPELLVVAGNMDLPEHDDMFFQMGVSINGRGRMIGDTGFFGVSGAPHSKLKTPYEISEERILALARAGYHEVRGARVKIFVPHAPPYGTRVDIIHAGIHVGSTAVRDFVEDHPVDAVVCGHIHESRGMDTIGETRIVNCGLAGYGYYAFIDTGEPGTAGTPGTPVRIENRAHKVL
jgi:Icc-related predicted phosphoesterase